MRIFTSHRAVADRRHGVVLLVVMAMLALFASLALTFVFYADSEAVAAQAFRMAVTRDQPDVDREVLASYFLSQLLYDTENVYSSMRGWSLARSLYGYNPNALNYTPFNGADRATALGYPVAFPLGAVNNFNMVNYQRFNAPMLPPNPADPYIGTERRPEHYGKVGDANFRYVGGANPPWTAYDTNNLFLALVGADGAVHMPSFYRPWSPSANDPRGKYLTVRPHNSWHPNFPLPEDAGGDVKQLEFGPGTKVGAAYANNDSIWMDLGFGVLTAKDGTRFKPLFAPLVMDLSNRLHLWAHGNRIGINNSHVSNLGMGVTEVNLGKVITNAADLKTIFDIKYGGAAVAPAGAPITFPTISAKPYSLLDFDALAPADSPAPAGTRGYGSRPIFFNFTMTSTSVVGAPGIGAMQVNNTFGQSYRGFRWSVYPGMPLDIVDVPPAPAAPRSEKVFVISVDHSTNTFVANFANMHPAGVQVTFGSATQGYPYFPPGWNNVTAGNPVESTTHPMGFNFIAPTAPNIAPLPMSQMEALLRFGGTNAPATFSEIFRRMPATFGNIRNRNMVTLASSHLDRVTGSPVLPFDSTVANQYVYDDTLMYPVSAVSPPPAAPWSGAGPPPPNSDFGPDWRSTLSSQLKVDLNRPLTTFPNSGTFLTAAQQITAQAAINDRQAFSMDIYNALVRATGARDPNKVAGMTAASKDYQAARWLAQLAANIVDYIDIDEYSTVFKWDSANNAYVFGVELPQAVLNELYVELDNDPADMMIANPGKGILPKASYNNLNLTIEISNPIVGGAPAYLEINDTPIHRVLIYDTDPKLTASLRDPNNPFINVGEPDATFTPKITLNTWNPTTGTTVTVPAGGFREYGPSQNTFLAGHNPNLAPNLRSPDLTLKMNNPNTMPGPVTFLLQRLAHPHLPPQNNRAAAFYNPYITIDYVDNIRVWDNREYDGNGKVPAPNTPTSFTSFGRQQPFVAGFQNTAQSTRPAANQPFNTFRAQNAPKATYEWLTHLDRKLINPFELVHVSAVRPHELTQQFVTAGGAFKHLAPWGDQKSMLYRALELFGVPNHLAGTYMGGRQPGILNLNTLTEKEIFRALCDAQDTNPTQPNPLFTTAQVDTVFDNIIRSRNSSGSTNLLPTSEGNPFQPFNTNDLTKALAFRPDPVSGPPNALFAIGNSGDHPYLRAALMQKLYNNVTTTSNVFAIWWTVGFFVVEDETVRPPRLGAEIGRAENRHIRHRFFAIVDRSGMSLFQTKSTAATTGSTAQWNNLQSYTVGTTVLHSGLTYTCKVANTGNAPATSPNFWTPVTMTVIAPTGTAGTVPIALQPGMLLEIGSGATGEVVRVVNVFGTTQFQAAFTKNHAANSPVICRGNPGPRQGYNPRQDSQVVLHLSVIQ